jgi:orotate phosphoribosyltransferase
MDLASAELARRAFERSNLKGTFRLRSGIISAEYVDKYRFKSDPHLLRAIAVALSKLIPPGADALAG